ncbi:adenomatous polyposis coli homolog [Copidosoma floridanum]|uniref:adenomatous polyposis coli homolog n=1 Tax=Copidosoma floridanum TaxID=29053 RepID=UPI0006C9B1A4|nr:adenomatous polyposis coli homolog [Copidosoma floridanum]
MTTRIARHASKKALTPVNINYKPCPFNHFPEADFDQTTNYSIIYAEENSIVEEVGHFDYLLACSEQENTVTTYYTEGTPFETPPHFSTSTSTSDLLRFDDLKTPSSVQIESRSISTNRLTDTKDKPNAKLESYMEFRNEEKECESTDIEIYLPDDSDEYDYKCDEDRSERIINVTPSQSPIEQFENDKEARMVTFSGEDRFSQQTPLMFSRCSSLGSLSGYEQQSLLDDRSSVISDFSRRTSEVVSPSELPDSPAQFIHSGQLRDKRLTRKKLQQIRDKPQTSETFLGQQEGSKYSVFEDNLAIFKEESTPVKFQSVAASSLSSLTIDDEYDVDEPESENKATLYKTPKTSIADMQISGMGDEKKKSDHGIEENPYVLVEEEKILDEYIKKGIAKVTKQNINDISSFNLHVNSAYDSDTEKLEPLDESSDLTSEEEQLLDECIRRGIAKVTRQNINDVSSLSLDTKILGVSAKQNCEKTSETRNSKINET